MSSIAKNTYADLANPTLLSPKSNTVWYAPMNTSPKILHFHLKCFLNLDSDIIKIGFKSSELQILQEYIRGMIYETI